jgi:hypothetical protein
LEISAGPGTLLAEGSVRVGRVAGDVTFLDQGDVVTLRSPETGYTAFQVGLG